MEVVRGIGGLCVFMGIAGCVSSVVGRLMLRVAAPRLAPLWRRLRRIGLVLVPVGVALLVVSVL
jgi:hypothetical protein